ncbi:MAG: glycosyltransferase [Anaerolineales bacterium]
MRIGMMADVYKPHVSGVTNYISLNKKWLEKFGHEVFVFTFGDEEYPDDEENVIRSPGLPLMDTGYYVGVRHSTEAIKLIRTMDVIHVHHPFISGTLALRYCRSQGIPIVFTNHTRYDLYARAYIPILGEMISGPALEAFLPVFCRAVDLVISPSNGMRDVLRKFGVDAPIEVVPNGVDIRALRKGVEPADRMEFGFTNENVVLIYVGRLGPEKNLPFLIQSFNGAIQAYPHIRLLLVGDGPERKSLEEQIEEYDIANFVRFTGMVSYDKVCRYLSMADIFVTASVTEVHPLSVIEAMAVGLPVLGIHSPGISDLIEDGISGYLIKNEDIAAFTAKMSRLIWDTSLRKQMSVAAGNASEKFAIENTVAKMITIYQGLVEKQYGKKRSFPVQIRQFFEKQRH